MIISISVKFDLACFLSEYLLRQFKKNVRYDFYMYSLSLSVSAAPSKEDEKTSSWLLFNVSLI